MKSVLCEMKSVLCEMKSVLCEMKICNFIKELLFSYMNHDRDTHFSILSRHRKASSWCLDPISKPGTTDKKKTIFQSLFAANWFGEISTEHCVLDVFVELLLRDGSVQ